MPDSVGGGGFPNNINIGHEHLNTVSGLTYQYQGGVYTDALNWKIIDGVTPTDPSTSGWGAKQLGAKWYNSTANTYKYWNGTSIAVFGPAAGASVSQTTALGQTVVSAQHGLGQIPTYVVTYYECVIAELGYQIGDRVSQGAFASSNGAGDGFMVQFDATTIRLLIAANAPVVVLNRTAPNLYALGTAANWKIVAIPYLA